MERYFVIETKSDEAYAHVYEVTKDYSVNGVEYRRPAEGTTRVMCSRVNPEFFGKLDAVLVTKDKLDNARPIDPIPVLPMGPVETAINMVDQAEAKAGA